MREKTYSPDSLIRHYGLALSALLTIYITWGIVGCAKNTDRNDRAQISTPAVADASIVHSEIQGLWILESLTKDNNVLFQSNKGFISGSEEVQRLFGMEMDKNKKSQLAFRISAEEIQTLVFVNGQEAGSIKDNYQFDNGKLMVEYNGNRKFDSRQILLQRSKNEIILIEKSWRMRVRKISDQQLIQILKPSAPPVDAASNSACSAIFEALSQRQWQAMEIDLSQIYDLKTLTPVTEQDLKARKLNTTIGLLRPQIKFLKDTKQDSLLYYSYVNENKQTIKRAFKILKQDSTSCTVGLTKEAPAQELKDFSSGNVEIRIFSADLESIKDKSVELAITWNNSYFQQRGHLYLR